MIQDLADSSQLTVSDDSATFALLLDAMLASGIKQPPITSQTFHAYAELARKYDVPNLALFCEIFVLEAKLTLETLPGWHVLADTYRMTKATAHCRSFAVGVNFRKIRR